MFLCVSITPLGKPVVPLEYGRITTSSSTSNLTSKGKPKKKNKAINFNNLQYYVHTSKSKTDLQLSIVISQKLSELTKNLKTKLINALHITNFILQYKLVNR